MKILETSDNYQPKFQISIVYIFIDSRNKVILYSI